MKSRTVIITLEVGSSRPLRELKQLYGDPFSGDVMRQVQLNVIRTQKKATAEKKK